MQPLCTLGAIILSPSLPEGPNAECSETRPDQSMPEQAGADKTRPEAHKHMQSAVRSQVSMGSDRPHTTSSKPQAASDRPPAANRKQQPAASTFASACKAEMRYVKFSLFRRDELACVYRFFYGWPRANVSVKKFIGTRLTYFF